MVPTKIIVMAVILVASASALGIETEGEGASPILQDLRNNITDQEWSAIIQSINEAETMYRQIAASNTILYPSQMTSYYLLFLSLFLLVSL